MKKKWKKIQVFCQKVRNRKENQDIFLQKSHFWTPPFAYVKWKKSENFRKKWKSWKKDKFFLKNQKKVNLLPLFENKLKFSYPLIWLCKIKKTQVFWNFLKKVTKIQVFWKKRVFLTFFDFPPFSLSVLWGIWPKIIFIFFAEIPYITVTPKKSHFFVQTTKTLILL